MELSPSRSPTATLVAHGSLTSSGQGNSAAAVVFTVSVGEAALHWREESTSTT